MINILVSVKNQEAYSEKMDSSLPVQMATAPKLKDAAIKLQYSLTYPVQL